MLSNKSMGIAGVAMLGTVAILGTNAANAALDLDAAGTMDDADERSRLCERDFDDQVQGHGGCQRGHGLLPAGSMTAPTTTCRSRSGIVSVTDETTILEITLEGLVFDADSPADSTGWTRRTGGARGETSATYSRTSSLDGSRPDRGERYICDIGGRRGLDRGDAD